MLAWATVGLFYLAMAGGVAYIARRLPTAAIAVTLMLCSATSTAVSFQANFHSRVLTEVICALALSAIAKMVFDGTRCWACLTVAVLAVLDIAFCVVVLAVPRAADWQGVWFGLITNVIFAVMCAITAGPGVSDAILGRSGRGTSRGMASNRERRGDVGGKA